MVLPPDVRVPGNYNFDILIEKRISFTEHYSLDFRTELFNAFNTVLFGGPQTNVISADTTPDPVRPAVQLLSARTHRLRRKSTR